MEIRENEDAHVGMTMCSTTFCYNWVPISDDPTHPAFCESCKARKEGQGGSNGKKKAHDSKTKAEN